MYPSQQLLQLVVQRIMHVALDHFTPWGACGLAVPFVLHALPQLHCSVHDTPSPVPLFTQCSICNQFLQASCRSGIAHCDTLAKYQSMWLIPLQCMSC
jgi:hypothetical protein